VTRVGENTTTVAVSKKSQFNQTIIIPDAIDALFGMAAEERFAEIKRACERDEVPCACNDYFAPVRYAGDDSADGIIASVTGTLSLRDCQLHKLLLGFVGIRDHAGIISQREDC
jgi:hypothetical protein